MVCMSFRIIDTFIFFLSLCVSLCLSFCLIVSTISTYFSIRFSPFQIFQIHPTSLEATTLIYVMKNSRCHLVRWTYYRDVTTKFCREHCIQIQNAKKNDIQTTKKYYVCNKALRVFTSMTKKKKYGMDFIVFCPIFQAIIFMWFFVVSSTIWIWAFKFKRI